MKHLKAVKILLIILIMTAVLCMCAAAFASYYHAEGTIDGKNGGTIRWIIGEYDDLKVVSNNSGQSVEMPDFSETNRPPWYQYRDEIRSITVGDQYYKVTNIGSYAFADLACCTGVTIENSVTNIGPYAFSGCSMMKTISIPANVTSIEKYAMSDCPELTTVTFGTYPKLESIGECAFGFCAKLSGFTIPETVTSLGDSAFCACEKLTSMTIPANITAIPNSLFDACYGLTSVTFSGRVTSIGRYAFNYCTELTGITLPDTVISIGTGAFSNCSKMTSCNIPAGVTGISDEMFAYCYELPSISIPDGVNRIGEYAFMGCSKLAGVVIPSTVRQIGVDAFYECVSLTSLTIPAGVTKIDNSAFAGCGNMTSITINAPIKLPSLPDLFAGCGKLTTIIFPENHPYYVSVDSMIYNRQKTSLLFCSIAKSGKCVIPDGVKSIGRYAFYECKKLTEVSMPDTVTTIGDYAFYVCTGLTRMNLPDSVCSIGDFAFHSCKGLTEITLPKALICINQYCFTDCNKLQKAVIPNGVGYIGSFAFNGCNRLDNVVIPDSVAGIGDCAFSGCKFTEITLSVGIKSLAQNVFDSNVLIHAPEESYAAAWAEENGYQVETYKPPFTVTITVEGDGTAAATPGSGSKGTEIKLKADPGKGSAFKEWVVISGGVTIQDNAFIMGKKNVEIKAVFEKIPVYTVTVTNDGNGLGAANPASGVSGTEVTLVAAPNDGYRLKEWKVITGGVTVTDNRFTIGTANVEVQAVFEQIPEGERAPGTYIVKVTSDGHGIGAANPASGTTGTEVALTYAPFTGYQFKEWQVVSGDVVITDNRFTVGNADVEIKAVFKDEEGSTVTVNGGKYKLNEGKTAAVFIGPEKTKARTLVIQDKVKINGKSYKVTEIAAGACKGMSKLTALTIGKNVKTIGMEAFCKCKKVKTITIPGTSLKKVGENAFGSGYKKVTVICAKKKIKSYTKLLQKAGLSKKAVFTELK